MSTAHFPELMVLLAILVSMAFLDVILTAMAVGFVFLVMAGMAGYGLLEMLTR